MFRIRQGMDQIQEQAHPKERHQGNHGRTGRKKGSDVPSTINLTRNIGKEAAEKEMIEFEESLDHLIYAALTKNELTISALYV